VAIKEHQEAELIIRATYELLANVADSQRFPTVAGPRGATRDPGGRLRQILLDEYVKVSAAARGV